MPGNWKPSVTKLPNKIRCFGCNKEKTVDLFSTTQQANARSEIHIHGIARAKCVACVEAASTKHEMKCIECDHWLSKDEFSKSHRKNPEDAVCMNCMRHRLMQDAPADIIKRQREEDQQRMQAEADYDDDEDEDDDYAGASSAMTTNAWETTSDGVSLTSVNASNAPSSSWNTTTAARATQSRGKDDEEEYDDDDDEDLYSAPRRVPVNKAAASTQASETSSGFRPVDPITNPSQYRSGIPASSGNVPQAPAQQSYQTDYNASASKDTPKFNYDTDSDDEIDPEYC